MDESSWTPEEMMIITAARHFKSGASTFVGVGQPSVAACVARELHAPDLRLVYESGVIGAKPTVAPLSIADSELAETADTIVSVPEMFAYWLQGGRIDVAFLGTAQIDRFGNLNTTVIGNYDRPRVRLPGAGGAPEIAAAAKKFFVIVKQSPKAFVGKLDFVTTVGCRNNLGAVITDVGVFRPDPETSELVLTSRHPGVQVNHIQELTAWNLRIASCLAETPAPSFIELATLRLIQHRTREAHGSTE